MDSQHDRYVHLYKEIGRRIREARKAKNVTQSELAEAIGLTRTSVTNIEKGRQKLLVHSLFEIAAALKVSLGHLIEESMRDETTKLEIQIPSTVSDKDRALIESAISPSKAKDR